LRTTDEAFIRRALPVLLVLGVLVAASDVAAQGRTHRLRRLVVVGDSLLAGYSSNGFVRFGRAGQVDSAPARIARQARVRLPQPLMRGPGVPPQLRIADDDRDGALDPGEVRVTSEGIGFRVDPDVQVRNLAVPGEDTASVFEEISAEDVGGQIISGDVSGRDVLKYLILGLPTRNGSVSQVTRARALNPSFIIVWIGSNDLLGVATRTDPGAESLGPFDFGERIRRLLFELSSTGADMAIANLPDPAGIASLRRAAGEVTSCRQQNGTTVPVAADDLLSIDLDSSQLPVPPCGEVLDAGERAAIRDRVIAFNTRLALAAEQVETNQGVSIAVVDIFSRFEVLGRDGVDLDNDGTPDLTTRYLGGIFSLDGIHPSKTGNALIANEFIAAINARYGESIPLVDVAKVARRDPLARSRFRPAGEVPFGLIGGPGDDLENELDESFDRIERRARRLGDRLERFFDRFL
jgi:lysophospholipase L1-like esterase